MASEKTAVHLTFKIFQIVVVVDYLPIALMNINLSALYFTIHDLRQRNNIAVMCGRFFGMLISISKSATHYFLHAKGTQSVEMLTAL